MKSGEFKLNLLKCVAASVRLKREHECVWEEASAFF